MRILYYHQHFCTPQGTGGTRSYEFARRLVEGGHEVTMVCGTSDVTNTGLTAEFVGGRREGVVDGISVVEFRISYSNSDGFVKRAISFLRFAAKSTWLGLTRPHDLLFATSTPLTAGIPGIIVRLLRRKPFVFEVRDLWPELPREMGVIKNPVVLWAMGVLEWTSYNMADACVGLSPGIVEGIKRRLRKNKPVHLIPNGCDLDLFDPSAQHGIPEIPGTDNDDFVAVFTGAHGMANGLDAVLDAAAELRKREHTGNIKIVFIGRGMKKPELQERAKREGLSNVSFLDSVPKMELVSYLQRADVGMMILANVPAFYYGTSPNKFFDYIASGLPVLTNYPGWLAEMIVDNSCGLAVEPGDAVAFADALMKMSQDKELLAQMSVNGRQLAERQFSRDQLADRFTQQLEAAHRP